MKNDVEEMPDKLKSAEEIAVELSDVLYLMVDLLKKLTSELAQYRVTDREEEEVQGLADKMRIF